MAVSWQGQVTLLLLIIGGGYLAAVNGLPPFDKNGLVDQLKKYLPKSNKEQNNDSSSSSDLPDIGQPQTLPLPIAPGQQGLPPMDNPLPLKPEYPDYKVYNDYATALRMQYGQGNNPNLGGGSGLGDFYGDTNLGTTPFPGMNGTGATQPPPYPFLPSPLTPNIPMMQPPRALPYPLPPPPIPLPSWIYQPIIPVGQPYWATWAVKRPLPYIYSTAQLYNIDLGIIDSELSGITINTFLQMGVKLSTIFPNGVNLANQYQIGVDLTEFVTVYLRLHKVKPSPRPSHHNSHGIGIDIDLGNLGGSINDMIQGIMNKVKGKLGGISSSGSGGLGDLFGGLFGNGSNTNSNVDIDNGSTSIPGPATGNNNGNNMFGNLFGNIFGSNGLNGANGSNNNGSSSNNNFNYGSSIPNANTINNDVFNQLRSMGIPGFYAKRAMMADVTPKQGFLNQRGSSSLQPHIKRTRHRNNGYLKRVSFT